MRKLLWALAVGMMLVPVAAWSLVSTTNKDFEDGFQTSGIANGWAAYDSAPAPVCAGDSATYHSGAWSQKVTSGGIKAAFTAPPGLCKVSVWVKAPTGVARVHIMGYEVDTGTIPPSSYMANTASNTWQKLTKTVLVKVDMAVVYCATYGGASYFDEITVEPVGEHIPPQELWWNQVNPGGVGGNPFLCGGVFEGSVIFGQVGNCVKMYGTEYVNDTPLVHQTPDDLDNDDYTAKCATILDGYIYCTTGYGDIRQSVDWGALGRYMPFNKTSTVPATDPTNVLLRKKVNNDASALVTDGTYLYAQDDNLGGNAATNTIYKWQMNHADGGSIVGNVSPFPKTITGYSQFLGICYWNGKIYAAEGMNGGQILEIDTTSGVVTPLLSAPNLLPDTGGNFGQVARYGDKIFVGTAVGHLYTWQLISGTWTLVSGYDLRMNEGIFSPNPGYVLGLAISGDGTNAKYAWVNTGGVCRYYDLYPPIAGDLGDVDFNSGNPAWVGNAVITALGPTDTGFWIENQGRTAGAWVPTTEVPTVGNLVSIKGTPSKSASGERTLTPSEAIVQGAAADPVLTPLMMTNKTLGLAAGGVGLATDGMLVKISGKVTGFVEADNFAFYIDDGSGVLSGIASPAVGVKVTIADGAPGYTAENFESLVYTGTPCTAVVTGIVRLDVVGGSIVRRIDARSAADIVITAL